jgi:hypothetical protein
MLTVGRLMQERPDQSTDELMTTTVMPRKCADRCACSLQKLPRPPFSIGDASRKAALQSMPRWLGMRWRATTTAADVSCRSETIEKPDALLPAGVEDRQQVGP